MEKEARDNLALNVGLKSLSFMHWAMGNERRHLRRDVFQKRNGSDHKGRNVGKSLIQGDQSLWSSSPKAVNRS